MPYRQSSRKQGSRLYSGKELDAASNLNEFRVDFSQSLQTGAQFGQQLAFSFLTPWSVGMLGLRCVELWVDTLVWCEASVCDNFCYAVLEN